MAPNWIRRFWVARCLVEAAADVRVSFLSGNFQQIFAADDTLV